MVDESKVPRLSPADAGKMLGLTRQAVVKMLQAGWLRGYHYPGERGRWRIAQADVDAYLRRARNVTEPRERA